MYSFIRQMAGDKTTKYNKCIGDDIILLAKGGGALCAGNAVALLVFGPVMP